MARKILLVEDDPNFRTVLALALELKGYRVSQVSSGQEAIGFLGGEAPDLIISDLEMTGIDGRALCKHARSNDELAGIPFVILSAFIDPDGEVHLSDLPADYCLSKQVSIAHLIRCIDGLLPRT